MSVSGGSWVGSHRQLYRQTGAYPAGHRLPRAGKGITTLGAPGGLGTGFRVGLACTWSPTFFRTNSFPHMGVSVSTSAKAG